MPRPCNPRRTGQGRRRPLEESKPVKVIPIAMVAFALADMVVFNAVQVPQPDAVFGQDVAWLEGTGAQSRVGLTVLTSELGIQSATPGDWIIGNDVGPVRVMADDQFKLEYAAAP